MNSENSTPSDTHRLLFNLSETQKQAINMLLYQILACTIRAKVKKCHEKKTNLEN